MAIFWFIQAFWWFHVVHNCIAPAGLQRYPSSKCGLENTHYYDTNTHACVLEVSTCHSQFVLLDKYRYSHNMLTTLITYSSHTFRLFIKIIAQCFTAQMGPLNQEALSCSHRQTALASTSRPLDIAVPLRRTSFLPLEIEQIHLCRPHQG